MNEQERLDHALDAAIDRLQRGHPFETAASAGDAAWLRPLLETADALRQAPPVPAPARLADNYTIVRAAVERAQMHSIPEFAPAPRAAWWRRRVSFASLSVPAGVAALVLAAGVSGAAASVMTGVGSEIAGLVRPDWVEEIIPGGKSGDAPGREHSDVVPPANDENPASPGGDAPGADNRPTFIEVSGNVSNVNGNTFTLTDGDLEWLVNLDANTEVSGEILEGALASVTGDVTAGKNLHADTVEASGGTPADAPGKPDDPGPPNDPGPSGTPGPPASPGSQRPEAPPGQSQDLLPESAQDNNDDGGSRKP